MGPAKRNRARCQVNELCPRAVLCCVRVTCPLGCVPNNTDQADSQNDIRERPCSDGEECVYGIGALTVSATTHLQLYFMMTSG